MARKDQNRISVLWTRGQAVAVEEILRARLIHPAHQTTDVEQCAWERLRVAIEKEKPSG